MPSTRESKRWGPPRDHRNQYELSLKQVDLHGPLEKPFDRLLLLLGVPNLLQLAHHRVEEGAEHVEAVGDGLVLAQQRLLAPRERGLLLLHVLHRLGKDLLRHQLLLHVLREAVLQVEVHDAVVQAHSPLQPTLRSHAFARLTRSYSVMSRLPPKRGDL